MTDAKPRSGESVHPLEERVFETKGTRLRYLVGGSGAPTVLVHGLCGAASNWVDLAPRLARSRRLLVPDLPGHGGSSPMPSAPALNPYADRLRGLAEHEGMRGYAVVGHSLGAVVALRMALRDPAAVSAVVLVSPAGIVSSARWAELVLTYATLASPGWALAPFRTWIARSALMRTLTFWPWAVSDPASLSPAAVEGLLEGPALHTDTLSAARALVRDDPRADLGAVRCPCLVVAGARDPQVPYADCVEYSRRLGARLRTIPDCGHLAIAERPDACADAIESFLGTL